MHMDLHIDMDNDAFAVDPGVEIARILRSHAQRIDGASLSSLEDGGTIFDINGARVGSWTVTPDEADTSEPGHEYVDPDED